jgi:putative transcriptional regulator
MASLKGHFLIAAASLLDPNFSRSVVLLLQHDDGGALGVVVNRPLDVTVRQACEQVLGVECDVDGPLHHGGPCEAVMMVLYPVDLPKDGDAAGDDDHAVVRGLRFSTDKDTIERLLREGPGDAGPFKVIVGYSGWGAGQLEGEMKTGSWLVVPATAARALGPAGPLWTRLVTEANLGKFVDPKWIPDDPSVN